MYRQLRIYHLLWCVLGLGVVLIVALGYRTYALNPEHDIDPPGVQSLAQPEYAPVFNLQDQHGQPFTPAALRGKWTIMLFGYTHCPDFCPTTLMSFNSALRRMSKGKPDLAQDTDMY